VLLDTSGLLCYLHRCEPGHDESVRWMATATHRLTHNYVLSELVALAHSRRLSIAPVLEFLDGLGEDRSVEVVYVDPELHAAAIRLLRDRPDKAWSLCDAVSFVLMARRGVVEALTTDRHFEQAGFVRLLRD